MQRLIQRDDESMHFAARRCRQFFCRGFSRKSERCRRRLPRLTCARLTQYTQLSYPNGAPLSKSRLARHCGRQRSISNRNRALRVGSIGCANSCTTMYSGHCRGFFANSVLSRIERFAGLPLPHLVRMRWIGTCSTSTPSRACHLACNPAGHSRSSNGGRTFRDRDR